MKGSPLCIIYYDLGLGGVQRKIVDICNFLAVQKKDLHIYILLRNIGGYSFRQEIKNKNVHIIHYPNWIKLKLPLFFIYFVLLQIWKKKPFAILAFSDMPSICAIFGKFLFFWRNINVVISEDLSLSPSKEINALPYSTVRHKLIKFFYPFADTIFCVNKPFARELIHKYAVPQKKIKIIRNWTRFRIHRKTSFHNKIYDLIYVGRFAKVKNLHFLISGIREVKKILPSIKLCLVGDGEQKDSLVSLTHKHQLTKNVVFIEPQLQIEHFLAKSKIFVLASKSEGLPMAALEAMSMQLPVISLHYPGVNELIKNKRLIYKDLEEFLRLVLALLNNPKKISLLGQEAKKYVDTYHSSRNIKVYSDTLGIT